jgi:hypothetical protein
LDDEEPVKRGTRMSDRDIYQILESLDAAQRSVKQLPALFKPAQTSPQLSGPYPGKNATRGYMVGEGEEESLDNMTSMGRAVSYRIANQHPEWFMKYGLDAVKQAIQDVTGSEDDWEEIGSSDVSAYVNYVGDYLRDHMGSREEMADRKPFAEETDTGEYDARKTTPSSDEDKEGVFARHRERVKNIDQDEQDVQEGLRAGEYHLATVTLDDGTKHKVKIRSDEGFREPIERHFKKQGRKVTDIDVDYAVRSDVYEGRDTATEDVLSTMKKKLGDYLQDVATAIKKDPDLVDQIPDDVDQIRAVKTIRTDDGHEIKIHGNEDDGFRISIRNKDLKTQFQDLDEATMAVEMYCARRRQSALEADYIDEKTS